MMPRLSKREQRTIVVVLGLAVLILWMYGVYIIQPLTREASALGQQVRSAREQLRVLESVAETEPNLRAQYHTVQQTVAALRKELPPEQEVPATIELLSALASKTHVKIQAIFPQRHEERERSSGTEAEKTPPPIPPQAMVYKEVPIQIDAVAGYHQLGLFLSLVETGQRPMDVLQLHIVSNAKEPRWHAVKLILRAFFATKGFTDVDNVS